MMQDLVPISLAFVPRHVLLFSGHMVDAPGRAHPRFPARKVAEAARRIRAELATAGVGAGDAALCQAAAGGDQLFAEACLDRGVHVQLLLPFDEAEFVERSILPSKDGPAWRDRYLALRSRLPAPPLIMSRELGPLPEGTDPFERCNLWLLQSALALADRPPQLVCLWDGGGGDGPGGTAHMIAEVKAHHGKVAWIDTRTLEDSPGA